MDLDIIHICLGLVPIPHLNLVYGAFKALFVAVQGVKQSERQLQALTESVASLVITLDREIRAGRLVASQIPPNVYSLQTLIKEITTFIQHEEGRGFLKSLFSKDERMITIDGYHRRLCACAHAFQVAALIDIQAWQKKHDDSQVADRKLLYEHLTELETNQVKLREALDIQQHNMLAMMTSLQNAVMKRRGDDQERRFFSTTLEYLAQVSGKHLVDVESWMVTSFDVEFGSEIGSGGFGQVFKGVWGRTQVALKVLRTDSGATPSLELVRREIKTWSSLLHPNIIQFLGANIFDDRPFIVMPFLRNGNARDYVYNHPNCDRMMILHHVSLGLVYLHNHNVIHGDLKALNVLIDDAGHALLCDFGLSHIKTDATTRAVSQGMAGMTVIGSRIWMSPERIMGGELRKPVDIYAFAMTMFEILTGKIPLGHVAYVDFIPLVVKEDVRPERPDDDDDDSFMIPDDLWSLIEACWARLPKTRPTALAVCDTIAGLLAPQDTATTPHSHREHPSPHASPSYSLPDVSSNPPRIQHERPSSSSSAPMPLPPRHSPPVVASSPPRIPHGHPSPFSLKPPETYSSSRASAAFPLYSPAVAPSLLYPPHESPHSPPVAAPSPPTSSLFPPPDSPYSTSSTPRSPASLSLQPHDYPYQSAPSYASTSQSSTFSLPLSAIDMSYGDANVSDPWTSHLSRPPFEKAGSSRPTSAGSTSSTATENISRTVSKTPTETGPEKKKFIRRFFGKSSNTQSQSLGTVLEVSGFKIARPAPASRDPSAEMWSLDDIIERWITRTSDTIKDEEFQNIVLGTYTAFTTCRKIFEGLYLRLNVTGMSDGPARMRAFIIIAAMEYWVTSPYKPIDPDVLAEMKELATSLTSSPSMGDKAKQIVAAINRKPDEYPLPSVSEVNTNVNALLDNTPKQMAVALTALEGVMYRRIRPADYLNHFYEFQGPSCVSAARDTSRKITFWVKQKVLRSDNIKRRGKAFKFFLQTAEDCYQMRNFSSTAAIILALESEEIRGLSMTRAELQTKDQTLLTKLTSFVKSERAYRTVLNSSDNPCVPYLEIHLQEMKTIFPRCLPVGEPSAAQINIMGCVALAAQIHEVIKFRTLTMREVPEPDRLVYLLKQLAAFDINTATNDELRKRSGVLGTEETNMFKRRALGF